MGIKQIPQDKGLDNTLEVLLKEGYEYILDKRKELDSNIFETRLLGEKTIALGGTKAAELFYNTDKFQRDGAMPGRVLDTLFGQDGVQTLDGKEHAHRKKMFLPLLTDEVVNEFHDIAEEEWNTAINKWKKTNKIKLYEEVQEILTRIITKWVGVPVNENDYRDLATDLTDMFEAPAKIWLDHRAGKKSRENREKWLVGIIEDVRDGNLDISKEKALYQFAMHRDLNDELLKDETVAVEILNLLRPTVAIAVYINFVALALHDFPEQIKKVQEGGDDYADHFVQEVRRYYPFFPMTAARVKRNFEWEGYEFKKGTLTLLDLYGTNHDKDVWENPDAFDPERFTNRRKNSYDLIPQGGGKASEGHRCPGEWITTEMMKVAVDFLVNKMNYELPKQDFSYSMTDMPSTPKDKIILTNIEHQS